MSVTYPGTRKKTYADSTSAGGLGHFLKSTALGESFVLREGLVAVGVHHQKLLGLCFDAWYLFLAEKTPKEGQLSCLFLLLEIRYFTLS